MPTPSSGLLLFVLDGQGIPSSTSLQTIQTAALDATSPLGSSILLACHQALVQDLDSLTSDERIVTGLGSANVASPETLLELPRYYPHDAIVANIHLYLIQVLRYLACNRDATAPSVQCTCMLGFSSGMLAASVIACAKDIPTFVSYAVGAFRLGFWLGLRVQQHMYEASTGLAHDNLAWSLVSFGSTRTEIQDAIGSYERENVSFVSSVRRRCSY